MMLMKACSRALPGSTRGPRAVRRRAEQLFGDAASHRILLKIALLTLADFGHRPKQHASGVRYPDTSLMRAFCGNAERTD